MGFKAYNHTQFHLSAGQTMREDVRLEVGAASESITVNADATLLRTESSELVHNITLTQLNNLPILVVGATSQGYRDPFQSIRLVPGIRYANGSAVNTLVINGTPSNSAQVRLEGQTQGSTRASLLGATGQTQPSVDAVEEVAILTSNFAPEFGTAGGAVINMVAKSGTNRYSGTAYDYAINEALNAHQPYTGARNVVRQHNWGFTFGGPVKLPKIYDGANKTFFFFSYEQYRERKLITNSATTVPIQAYRDGDFSNLTRQENRLIRSAAGDVRDPINRTIQSGTIFDPATEKVAANGQRYRDPFVDNKIPLTRFDDLSKKILPLIPQPTGPLAATQALNNYMAPYRQDRTSYIPSIKIDQNLGSSSRISVYYHNDRTDTPRSPTGADAFPDQITGSIKAFTYSKTARVNYDYTITPTLLLHVGLGWNDIDFGTAAILNDFDLGQMGFIGQTATVGAFPVITTGTNGNVAIGGMSGLGSGSNNTSRERRPSGNISTTYVRGGHTYKLGVEYRRETFPDQNFSNTSGSYTFGSNWTQQPSLQSTTLQQGFHGFQFASFLLGGMTNATVAAPVVAASTKSQTALFIQDNWKVTRKLTIDYGLRWDYGTYARERQGRYSSFGALVANPAADGKLGGRQFESVCQCNFADNYPYAIGPRLGMSYQLNNKTVLRGGVGVVYNSTSVATGGLSNTAFTTTPAAGSGLIIGQFKDGIPAGNIPRWPTTDPSASQGYGSVIVMPFLTDQNAGRPARLLQWNVTLQREINRDLVVEAAYVANRGSWWEANALSTVNLLSESVLRKYGFNDFTSQAEANLVNNTGLSAAQRQTLAARGVITPYPSFPIATQNVRQSLLPFPQYSGNSVQGAPLGKTWYDSFQLTVNKRLSHGVSFNVNYNYSKNLELTSSPDPFNRAIGKNLATFDLPHQLRISGLYEVPQLYGKGIPVLSSNKVVSYIFSGWGLGWYLNYQSAGIIGRPTSNLNPSMMQFLGRGPGGAQLKKDADGNFMNPWATNWTDYDGKVHSEPIDINCHCFDPTKTVVFNKDAWENIPAGQWGAQQGGIRYYRGFRIPQENANFSRTFRFSERVNLNVRVEFQNIFNRTQLPAPTGGSFGAAPTTFGNDPVTGLPTKNTGLYSGGFGTINPTSGTGGMRSGIFVGRINF
jgi:hypothetical protein